MTDHRRTRVAFLVALACATFWVSFLGSVQESQAWVFEREGQACYEPNESNVEIQSPAVMFMLDKSGSMHNLRVDTCCVLFVCVACGDRLWTVAVNAIKSVVQDLTNPSGPDDVIFGLGYFSGSTASIATEAAENNYSTIANSLDSNSPGGGTPTHVGINVTKNSATLNFQDRPSAGVLITDGQPGNKSATINAACQMRAEGKLLYVVGLGGGTDTAFNNKLAAAAGIGCCGGQANPGCTNGIGTDPCTQGGAGVSESTCHGSIQANNYQAFHNALATISNEVACTFPIDLASANIDAAPEDPSATMVTVLGANGNEPIPHVSVNNGEGWFFNSEARTRVTLSPTFCARVQSGEIGTVRTQLACQCEQPLGQDCEVPSPPSGVCPQGTWGCNEGFDQCQPYSQDTCPDPCFAYEIGARCHVDNPPPHNDGEDTDWITETNRCKLGTVQCTQAGPICEPLYEPMPELCNGLDDDCDGVVDNITQSWAKPEFSGISISSNHPNKAAACFVMDSCSCINARGEHAGEGATQEQEFDAFLDAWTPECLCGEALRPGF